MTEEQRARKNEAARRRYAMSSEEQRARWREKDKRYRNANPEKDREAGRRWRAANRDYIRAKARRWNASEKGKAAQKAYRERQRLLLGRWVTLRPRCLTDDERAQRRRDSVRRYREKIRAALAPEREQRRLERERIRLEKEQHRIAITEQKRLEREQRALTRADRRREYQRLRMRKYRARDPEKFREYGRRAYAKNSARYRIISIARKKRHYAVERAAVLFLRSIGVEIPKGNDAARAAALAYVRQSGLLAPP